MPDATVPATPLQPMMNLETLAPMNVRTLRIPDGDAGTAATIAAMRQLIDEGKKDPVVYELARSILRRARVPAFDLAGEARAIYEAVRRNMRFTRDIRGKETLHSARELVRLRMGDCDDYCILLCSMLESIGLGTHIVTVANDERDPQTFTHVYPEVWLNGRWVAVDAARKKPAFGKAPRMSFRTRWWDTGSPEFADVAGLAGMGSYIPGPAAQIRGLRPPNPRMPTALRKALGAYVQNPTYVRPPAYAPRGQGNYGLRNLHGLALGDDSALLQELPSLISSAGSTAASLIDATSGGASVPPGTVIGYDAYGTPLYNSPPVGIAPSGYDASGNPIYSSASSSLSGSSTGTLLLLGALGIGAVLLITHSEGRR